MVAAGAAAWVAAAGDAGMVRLAVVKAAAAAAAVGAGLRHKLELSACNRTVDNIISHCMSHWIKGKSDLFKTRSPLLFVFCKKEKPRREILFVIIVQER